MRGRAPLITYASRYQGHLRRSFAMMCEAGASSGDLDEAETHQESRHPQHVF